MVYENNGKSKVHIYIIDGGKVFGWVNGRIRFVIILISIIDFICK